MSITTVTDPDAAERMSRARMRLLFNHAWWASLALHLTLVEDRTVDTLCTDGTLLRYSPEWVMSHTEPEVQAGTAHETGHCAFNHMYRMAGREPGEWNESCDLALNLLLQDSGFTLPADALVDEQYRGMSAEQVYAARQKQKQEQQNQQQQQKQGQQQPQPQNQQNQQQQPSQNGTQPQPQQQPGQQPGQQGQGQPQRSPCFTPAPEPGDERAPDLPEPLTELNWQVLADEAALVANKAGTMSTDLERAIEQVREAQLPWQVILRRFVQRVVPKGYSWSQPNRRFIHNGLYLPSRVKKNTPTIATGIDTSGSVSQDMLNEGADEITGLMREMRPKELRLAYCDASIQGEATFTPDDEVVFEARGGGGTAFQPLMDWVEGQEQKPACLIIFTDLMGSDNHILKDPGIPVLWITPEWVTIEPPFGEKVALPVRSKEARAA